VAAPHRPPRYTKLHPKLFAEWAGRESGSKHFAAMGESSLICPPTMIRGHERIEVGEDVVVLPGCVLSVVTEFLGVTYEPLLRIGNGVRIGSDAVIGCCGLVDIQDKVLTADRIFIGDTYHGYRDPSVPILDQPLADPRPVTIETGAFLGINSAVLAGVTVGTGACVAANAVVTKDVPPHSLVAGNPARVVRRWDGERWIDV
jgi:acetyltransferase-like isoleucine patch superfamily enzyme